ncbi:histidine kinase dimerization/phospho-acceptor domain-containing protein [Desulfosoma sp.]|uniref:histidine kinase dimerization/phospho-acceptor domain-containing protein n=1 Tax=Desulfosoma sp. TaxID=2603217 RepID=UPI00404AA735
MKKHGRFLWAYLPALSAVGMSGVECFQGASCLRVLLVPWAILSLVMSYLLVRMLINERAKDEFTGRQLLQAQKMATIGEMASGIAHEVNNPLAVIGREVEWIQELLKEHPPADAEAAQEIIESLQVIGGQVARCAEFTHRLLNFARKSEPVLQWVESTV